MTSSLRNSIHRRNHKERSQLAHRAKFGILEKHADYVKRARDYHSKQDRLTRLKQKAAEKNKDEFYFSMKKEKTKNGVHIKDRGNSALPTDIVKVLKTQDENYIRTTRAAGLKKIDKIKRQLTEMADLLTPLSSGDRDKEEQEGGLNSEELEILTEAGILSSGPRKHSQKRPKPTHIVFVGPGEQAPDYVGSQEQPNVQEIMQDIDLGWKPKQSHVSHKKRKSVQSQKVGEIEQEQPPSSTQTRKQLLKELSARLFRNRQLRYAERELEMQRLMMGKGSRQKIKGVEKLEGEDRLEEDEDEIDARRGKQRVSKRKVDEATYKPRVYKWRSERKR